MSSSVHGPKPAPASRPVVQTGSGPVRGVSRAGVVAFEGVPYAADPVGSLRFAPPEPSPEWTVPLEAAQPGPAAPQSSSRLDLLMGRPRGTSAEAGCLTLNVWTPDTDGTAPVLFWVHGGAWVSGSGGWDWYCGARLAAAQGIVVVTINYRLGALGYLHLGELAGDAGGGNFGLQDQMAALEWTVGNIAAFGGDPTAVTVGGQSAGAHSAAMLAASPRTRRHVRRVLLQSGGTNELMQTPEHATAVARDFLEILGTGDDIGLLRAIAPEDLLAAQGELARRRGQPGSPVLPFGVVAGELAPAGDGRTLLAREAEPELDVMVGWTRDEFLGFARLPSHADEPASRSLSGRFGVAADELHGHYAALYPDRSPAELVFTISGDEATLAPILRFADERAARDVPTYVYRFDWSGSRFGACHCVDLPFTFGNLDTWSGAAMLGSAPPESLAGLADAFGGAIGSFVRSGNPGVVPGAGRWPAYDRTRRAVLRFDTACEVEPELGQREKDFVVTW